jgi:hypothetical protein
MQTLFGLFDYPVSVSQNVTAVRVETHRQTGVLMPYRLDYNYADKTAQGSPIAPSDSRPKTDTKWWACRRSPGAQTTARASVGCSSSGRSGDFDAAHPAWACRVRSLEVPRWAADSPSLDCVSLCASDLIQAHSVRIDESRCLCTVFGSVFRVGKIAEG